MGTDDTGSNLPASPQLKAYIDDLRHRQTELGAEIRHLQAEEDRLRHRLAQEVRHREMLRESASRDSGDDRAAAQALSSPQIIAADETVERLREELHAVRERLTGAERERDRLKEQVTSLEEINTSTQDLVDLHYERAEFERRRYERGEEQIRALRALVDELEGQLRTARSGNAPRAAANGRLRNTPWWQRLTGRQRDG
ncbi:hypothetical protein [Pseudonocardia endophytica]|uniref:Uncharacterized protein n=1 Tax=Pseudonocardia endophytica TaxID=401976 RepID=A0A4R1I4H8_PSEEN|nr:hypothetical protein [Pseudonocardia endophytica]TCK24932.1 hypothetical protein EV378_0727 [Pseudonocardia endophytica]